MFSDLVSKFRPKRRATWWRVAALYVVVLAGVEAVVVLLYSHLGLDRVISELAITFVIASTVGLPVIAYSCVQQEKLEILTDRLAKLSSTDQMTGLLNRQTFLDRLDLTLFDGGRDKSCGVFAYLDGDHFKMINDRFGHAAGDQVIMLIAEHIRQIVRANDLAARLGGEEFGIFFMAMDIEKAAALSDKLRRDIELSGRALSIPGFALSVSIGLATHRRGEGAMATMGAADRSLYAAKREGRNAVVIELRRYRAA